MSAVVRNVPSTSTLAWVEEHFPGIDPLRRAERASIRAFMETNRGLLRGRVLDFGAGQQPYRDLVEGEYVAFEKRGPGGLVGPFDAVMCTQVMQYLDHPKETIGLFHLLLKPGGHLVMTYGTNWPEVEEDDCWRFTKSGMRRMVEGVGFEVLAHERRAEVAMGVNVFALGYGIVARKN